MKELQIILKESERLARENVKTALATVVDVQGSGYRLPGARMLICETGETFGTVSGGCLESDVLERARQVLRSGAPIVLTYDTRGNADSVFSLNMGCNGVVRILIEPIENNSFFSFLEKCLHERRRAVVATLINAAEDKFKIGSRFFFDDAAFDSVDYSTRIERDLFADAAEIFAGGHSQCKTYEIENETLEYFLEIIVPPVNLLVFGAGYDAVPLAEFAKYLGWRVSLIDHRPAYAAPERFPSADEILISRPENLNDKLVIDKDSVAVIMTHNYAQDREILKFLLGQPLGYLGALGPKRRTENLLQELREQNAEFSEAQLKKLYAPIGLDIGGTNPETIALSIIAEIQSVLANRQGGFLRNRQGSIYNR